MARVKGALNARKKHKKVLKMAKGFVGARSKKLFRLKSYVCHLILTHMTYR